MTQRIQEEIMPRTGRRNGYSDQNCKLYKRDFFVELWDKMGSQYQQLLFNCNSHRLSNGNFVALVENFQDVKPFLKEENLVHAERFAISYGT
jgi:hypothetical protein